MRQKTDLRNGKTHHAIINAFNKLVLQAKGRAIRVSDIIRQADVGRSTFYEHFPNADTVFDQAVRGPLAILADATLVSRNLASVIQLLEHFADNRLSAQELMSDVRTRDRMVRVLAEQYETRLATRIDDQGLRQLSARQLSESILALVRTWLCGDIRCDKKMLATIVLDCAAEIADVFLKMADPTQSDSLGI